MSTVIRPTTKKYYISKNRFYELKHFCLQYDEWKTSYQITLDTIVKSPSLSYHYSHNVPDKTVDISIRLTELSTKIKLVEETAEECDKSLYPYIMQSVTKDRSFTYLSTIMEIPCCRNTFYDRYRKFFWILDKKRD